MASIESPVIKPQNIDMSPPPIANGSDGANVGKVDGKEVELKSAKQCFLEAYAAQEQKPSSNGDHSFVLLHDVHRDNKSNEAKNQAADQMARHALTLMGDNKNVHVVTMSELIQMAKEGKIPENSTLTVFGHGSCTEQHHDDSDKVTYSGKVSGRDGTTFAKDLGFGGLDMSNISQIDLAVCWSGKNGVAEEFRDFFKEIKDDLMVMSPMKKVTVDTDFHHLKVKQPDDEKEETPDWAFNGVPYVPPKVEHKGSYEAQPQEFVGVKEEDSPKMGAVQYTNYAQQQTDDGAESDGYSDLDL